MTVKYVSIPFKGGFYMCVEGSKRADSLQRANRAWTMGYDELANDLLSEAMELPGCAFEDRELENKATNEDRDGYWSDLAAYRNLYN